MNSRAIISDKEDVFVDSDAEIVVHDLQLQMIAIRVRVELTGAEQLDVNGFRPLRIGVVLWAEGVGVACRRAGGDGQAAGDDVALIVEDVVITGAGGAVGGDLEGDIS